MQASSSALPCWLWAAKLALCGCGATLSPIATRLLAVLLPKPSAWCASVMLAHRLSAPLPKPTLQPHLILPNSLCIGTCAACPPPLAAPLCIDKPSHHHVCPQSLDDKRICSLQRCVASLEIRPEAGITTVVLYPRPADSSSCAAACVYRRLFAGPSSPHPRVVPASFLARCDQPDSASWLCSG